VNKTSTNQISVPHADGVFDADFSHQETVHPAKTELNKLDTLLFQVLGQIAIDTRCEITEGSNLALNAGLSHNVVILDAIEQLGQAPEGVSLDRVKNRLRELSWVHARLNIGVPDVDTKEYLPERRHQVIDALNVAAGWVADRP
jgi:hypothetical protein